MPDFLDGGRSHKERHQPKHREKWGLLEKKKDYVKRAKDFHKKENEIQRLREKASFKNPDEFYFAMQSGQVSTKGVHGGSQKRKRGANEALERKSALGRDLGYVTMKKKLETKKIEELQKNLHQIRGGGSEEVKHTLFFEDQDQAAEFDPVEHFESTTDGALRHYNRPRQGEQQQQAAVQSKKGAKAKKVQRQMDRAYEELQLRQARERKLTELMVEIKGQSSVMEKGKKSVVNKTEVKEERAKPIYKWKKERKR